MVEHLTGSGHDLTAREFEPHVGLCADSSEPGACFGVCVSLSLSALPVHALSFIKKKMKTKVSRRRSVGGARRQVESGLVRTQRDERKAGSRG